MKLFSLKILIHLLILRPFVKLLFGVNLYGKENLSGLDNYIIVSNHNSHIDIFLLFYLLPLKHINKTHPVAAKEYFSRSRIVFFLVNYLFSPVWVNRGQIKANVQFLETLRNKLNTGHNLIIFPEGTRGSPGELQAFKGSVGKIAHEYSQVPIIPVFMSGPERLLPRKSVVPIPIWNNITIGQPQVFEEAAKVITNSLEETIRQYVQKDEAIRHKRKSKKKMIIPSIAVLGIDGSGKSTLSRNIAKELSKEANISLLSDRLQSYRAGDLAKMPPFISEYTRRIISSYAKNARSLRFYKIPKLIELLLRNSLIFKIRRWYKPEIIILDGSPVLNLTAWSILYKEKEFDEEMCSKAIRILCSTGDKVPSDDPIFGKFKELKKLRQFGFTNFDLPDRVIFLDTDPATAIGRIEKRGERMQVHEKEDKLAKLRMAYLSLCKVLPAQLQVPTLIISGDKSIEASLKEAIDFINTLKNEEHDYEKTAH